MLRFPIPCLGTLSGMIALTLCISAAQADDCQPIVTAIQTTLKAPAYRQYLMTQGNGQERLMTIVVGKSAYLMLGGAGSYHEMPRQEIDALAKEAIAETTLQSCMLIGNEALKGVATKVYQYSATIKDGEQERAKVWIDANSLLRKQGVKDGELRYDYENVQAPDK